MYMLEKRKKNGWVRWGHFQTFVVRIAAGANVTNKKSEIEKRRNERSYLSLLLLRQINCEGKR
jgi:hypothetical protein